MADEHDAAGAAQRARREYGCAGQIDPSRRSFSSSSLAKMLERRWLEEPTSTILQVGSDYGRSFPP